MTVVIVLSAPEVVRPSSDLNIQKKFEFTCRANSAPDAMARARMTGETPSCGAIGAMMPAAVMAATA